MVIQHPVLTKAPLVGAGGDHRFVPHLQRGGQRLLVEGGLNPHLPGLAVFIPQGHDVAPKIDEGTRHPLPAQALLQPIGDVALGHGPQVDRHFLVEQLRRPPFKPQIFPVHMGRGPFQLLRRRHGRIRRLEIPQAADRRDGHVQRPIRLVRIIQCQPEQPRRLLGHRHRLSLRVIQVPDVAALQRPAE